MSNKNPYPEMYFKLSDIPVSRTGFFADKSEPERAIL